MLIIVETFRQDGEQSGSQIRVRPVTGQGFSPKMRVECSKAMRTAHPVGQLFLLEVTRKSKEDGPDFLYSYYGDSWTPVTRREAEAFITSTFRKRRK